MWRSIGETAVISFLHGGSDTRPRNASRLRNLQRSQLPGVPKMAGRWAAGSAPVTSFDGTLRGW
jgi:hypothetical protein